jgi:3-oxoadipate enol-lactonase
MYAVSNCSPLITGVHSMPSTSPGTKPCLPPSKRRPQTHDHLAYGDHTCFHNQVDAFAEDYYLIFVDMPGHGQSQVRGGNVTIEKTIDLVGEIIAADGYAQAHLVGVSLGALMAQAVADRYPSLVKSVISTGGYSIFGDNSAISKAQNREIVKSFLLILFNIDGFRRYVVKNTNVVEAERQVFYRAMQKFTRRSLPVLSGMDKILDKSPRTLSQPLLVLVGEHDLPILLSHAQEWQKREPDAQLRVIPNAGHCANMDNPAEFNRVLAEFINSSQSGK